MKAIAGILALALWLGACQTTSLPVANPAIPVAPSSNPTVRAVQDASAKACGFLPTASTVAAIVGKLSGYGEVAALGTNVAAAICETIRRAQPMAVASARAQEAFAQLVDGPRASIPSLHRKKEREPEKAKRKIERVPPRLEGVPLRGQFVR